MFYSNLIFGKITHLPIIILRDSIIILRERENLEEKFEKYMLTWIPKTVFE